MHDEKILLLNLRSDFTMPSDLVNSEPALQRKSKTENRSGKNEKILQPHGLSNR